MQSQYDDDRSQADSQHSTSQNKRVPHYALGTTAQALPDYSNAEAEAIRQSFSTGSYRMIAHLPTDIKPHHVTEATANRIDDNITSAYFVAPHGTYRKFGAKDTLFSTFDYQPDEYALASKLIQRDKQSQEEERLKVNPLPFLYSTPRPQLINGLAGTAPYEENAKYVDKYESVNHDFRRQSFLDTQKILHGPFVPSHGSRSIGDDRVIRLKLPDIIEKLMREIDADWSDAEFQIYADAEDLIIVQFAQATIDNPKGLLAYMNMFVKTNKVVSEYALAKLVELWNHAAEGFLYFAFRPPWVKRRAEESFFVLHPEMSVPGGKFIEAPPQKQLEGQEQLLLTAGSGASTARSQAPPHPHLQSSSSQQQPVAATAPQVAAAAGVGGNNLSASANNQPVIDEREQMAHLMASFDAGLAGRKPGTSPRTN